MSDADTHPFPPLALANTFPLHWSREPIAGWWACQHPEKPYDPLCYWDWRCPRCVAHAEAVFMQNGEIMLQWTATKDAPPELVTLGWMVARSRYWGVR